MAEQEPIDSDSNAREFKFVQAVVSDVGLKREENQDSYGYAHTDRVSFYLVADGMGGARGGGTASALAVDTILRNAFNSEGNISEDSLRSAIELANEVIFERSREDLSLSGMGTTLVALVIEGRRAIVAHVGDSRIYFCRDGALKQLTRDHTLVQELVESGAIKPEEAAHHPIAHMLTRSLGPAGTVQPEIHTLEFDLQPGDRFLLCSDGMYNLVEHNEIEAIFGREDADVAADRILELVLERGASDNTTIEILHVHDAADESVSFAIPEPGKIRVVTSGEVPEFAPDSADEDQDDGLISQNAHHHRSNGSSHAGSKSEEHSEEEIKESVVNTNDFLHQESTEFDGIVDSIEESAPADDGAHEYDEPVSQLPADEVSAVEPFSPEIDQASASENRVFRDPSVTELHAEVFDSVSIDPLKLDSEPVPRTAFPGNLANLLPIIMVGAIGVLLAVITVVIMSEPDSGKSPIQLSSATTQKLPAQVAPSPVATVQVAVEAEPTTDPNFGSKPPLFHEDPGAAPNGSLGAPTINAAETPQQWPGSARTEAVAPAVSQGRVVPPLPRALQPAEIAPEFETILTQAATRGIPPMPSHRQQNASVAPINWDREHQLRQELETTEDAQTVPAQFLSDQEKQEVLSRKIDIRESISDLDMKILALGTRSRDELDVLYAKTSAQLSEAQRAFDETKGTLEITKGEYQRWKKRSQIAAGGAGGLASELVQSNSAVRAKKQEYDEVLVRYRNAVEAYGSDPQNMTLVTEMGTLAREQKTKQAELEQTILNAIEGGLQQSLEKLVNVSIAVDDLEMYAKRLSRHLGFIRGAQPNLATSNQQLLERSRRERERLTSEFDRLGIQLSEYSENELRRAAKKF